MVIVRCQRCNRRLTDPISRDRGYGPVCFGKIPQVNSDNGKILHLEKEIESLKKQMFAITTTPTRPMPPVPIISRSNGNNGNINDTSVPVRQDSFFKDLTSKISKIKEKSEVGSISFISVGGKTVSQQMQKIKRIQQLERAIF